MTDVVRGSDFLNQLYERGIVPRHVRRIVIDAPYNGPITVLMESLWTDEDVKVVLTDSVIEILKGAVSDDSV